MSFHAAAHQARLTTTSFRFRMKHRLLLIAIGGSLILGGLYKFTHGDIFGLNYLRGVAIVFCWLALLARQSGEGRAIGWDEIVTGYDFGLLGPGEIQGWLEGRGPEGPLGRELASLGPARAPVFEETLWAACEEATGKVPRPGGRRWAAAQDRWRVALLLDALASPLTAQALAVAVESIYERVGCPEDMLGLWRRYSPCERRPGVADRDAIAHFLQQREGVVV